jgi:lantibiotic modifying enzyme
VYRALGPDLYAGTSGVGLFLAELYAVTSDPTVARTARGALQQALTQANRLPPRARFGLYTGWVGLAYAAVRSGLLLNDDALVAQATRLLHNLRKETTAPGHDLLSGSAGAIIGLLALAQPLAEPTFQQLAVQLGAALIATADRQPRGYSWRGPGSHNRPNLTGLSHGAAGIGLALLELFAATGDAQFRAAGEAAYTYEQSWFDPLEGNWPDFRFARTGRRGAGSHTFATYWCHGAPGIALSRLRAYELLGERCYAEQAAVARQTTEHALLNTLSARFADCSLCHGVIGNAEVLMRCAQILPPAPLSSPDLVDLVARTGIAEYEATGQPWPGGVPGGHTPGLMLGLAGTGLFYLRLHHPATPSVLFIPAGGW